MSINSTWAISSFVVWPRRGEEVTSRASYARTQITVDNRDLSLPISECDKSTIPGKLGDSVGFRPTALKASSFFSLFQLKTCSKNFGGKFLPSATACNTSHTSMRPGTSDRPGDTPMGRPPRRASIEIGVPKPAGNASVNSGTRRPRTVFGFCCIRPQQVLSSQGQRPLWDAREEPVLLHFPWLAANPIGYSGVRPY